MRIITRLLFLITTLTIAIANASQGGDVKQTVLPLKIIENMPMISVQIQNKTFSVFVDTGNNCAALSLFPDGRQGIALKYSKEVRCFKNTNGKTICSKRYEIPTVKIGDFVFKNVSGLELNQFPGAHTNEKGEEQEMPEQFKNTIFKYGTIGIDLFKENRLGVLFDYPGSKLVLTKQGAFPVGYDIGTWKKIPFSIANSNSTGILTGAIINGTPYVLMWDSGASDPVIFTKNKKLFCKRMFDTGKKCDYLRSKSFIIAGHKLHNTNFLIIESKASPSDGSLGGSYVNNKLLFIDFEHDNLFLKELETES